MSRGPMRRGLRIATPPQAMHGFPWRRVEWERGIPSLSSAAPPLLQRSNLDESVGMKEMADRAETAGSLAELLGIEGNAARLYFGDLAGMMKPEDVEGAEPLPFEMDGRNRRPPRDPVNAMLSLGYSLLAKDLTVACYAVGFDPYVGFYHQPRFGRPALALDLMEPFRSLIVDSAVLTAVNTSMVTARDFVRAGGVLAAAREGAILAGQRGPRRQW